MTREVRDGFTLLHGAMGALTAGGALAALIGGTFLVLAANNDCDSSSGLAGCAGGAGLVGVGAALATTGIIIGPRSKTILTIDGHEY